MFLLNAVVGGGITHRIERAVGLHDPNCGSAVRETVSSIFLLGGQVNVGEISGAAADSPTLREDP